MYGIQGGVSANVLPYGQIGLPPPNSARYSTLQNFVMPAPHIVQYGRPNFTVATAKTIPSIQTPQNTGIPVTPLAQPRRIVPNHILLSLPRVVILNKQQVEPGWNKPLV
ncbi:hypothetical protein LguiA_005563 [Lonicera macranthoides]